MRRWWTIASWVGLLLAVGCSKAPDGHDSPWWMKLLGVLAVMVIIVIVVGAIGGAIFGTNKLFSKFLTEVCDAKKPEEPPADVGVATPGSGIHQLTQSSDNTRVAFGATLTLISLILLAAAPNAVEGSKDFGVAAWPLYWTMIFGPYYVVRYWGAPRRGGSSSRIVLLLVCAAIVFGWAYHFGL